MAAVSYTPTPNEKAYMDALFQVADTGRQGHLGGAEAVGFFTRSKLPMEVLKNVWTVVSGGESALDLAKFYTAVRLIQLAQHGVQGQGATLQAPPGQQLRPAMFEGVSGVSVPLPPPDVPAAAAAVPPVAAAPVPQPPAPPVPDASRPPLGPPTTGMSMALTAQDPYVLPPNEQARYEQLFPQYATDGFVGGPAAVELFSKSGVDTASLGSIWNLVDPQQGDKLNALEFALCMHLIVCVSKKNLPLPPSLPPSLTALKSQQSAAVGSIGPSASFGSQQQMPSPALAAAAPPSPVMQQPMPSPVLSAASGPPPLPGPPPLQQAGGLSISDAFEGLAMSGSGGSGLGMASAADGAALSPAPSGFGSGAFAAPPSPPPGQNAWSIPEPEPAAAAAPSIPEPPAPAPSIPEPTPMAAPVVAAAAPVAVANTRTLAASYDQADESTELAKLQTVLQKLQAENISLKASLGSMSEEERETQKEIAACVQEIGRLSTELTGLRAQVLAAKSSLLEATAELKFHKDKVGELNDLIADTRATKEALDVAYDGVHDVANDRQAPAAPAPAVAEADLFGGWGTDAGPAPAPLMEPVTAPHPAVLANSSEDSSDVEEVIPGGGGQPQPQQNQWAAQHNEAPLERPPPVHERLPSYAQDGLMGGASGSLVDLPPVTTAAAPTTGGAGVPPSPTAAEVEQLKSKALQAESAAREQEQTSRTLASHVEDLRKIADQAEAEAREKEAHANKKKGGFGRGKRKEHKEVEKAKQDANAKRKEFLALQAEANTAVTLAMETKKEADQLREAAEKAEMEAVAAQSRETFATQQVATNGGGYAGYEQPKQPEQENPYGGFGNGGAAMGGYGGFGNGAMGGAPAGGDDFGIPSPEEAGVGGYDNPFG